MMPSNAGRGLRPLGFAQATGAPGRTDGLCAGRIRGLGPLRRAAGTGWMQMPC
jgi:hypothetical protein